MDWLDLLAVQWTLKNDYVDHNKLWKILKEMGVPDHVICLQIYLYAGQEARVRIGHGTADWFQIGKGACQGCVLSPCLLEWGAIVYSAYKLNKQGDNIQP